MASPDPAPGQQPPAGRRDLDEVSTNEPRIRGPLAVAGVTLGMLTWPIAFNLGVYGEVFYEDIFQIVVASAILLVITLVNPIYEPPWRWLAMAALAAPLL